MAVIIKNHKQIKGIRKSCRLASQTLDYITPFVKEGISTEKINQLIHQFIIKYRAQPASLNYKGFPKSVCTSVNDVVCHGIPSPKQILKSGDILNIDVTTILNSYYGDTSRMFTIGRVSKEAKLLIQRTQKAMMMAIEKLAPGKYLNDCVGKIIEPYVKKFGYSPVRDLCGHGVGIEFHEDPSVFFYDIKQKDVLLKPGMVLTVEPMINASPSWKVTTDANDGWTIRTADGALSAQWEHTVLITQKGREILTRS